MCAIKNDVIFFVPKNGRAKRCCVEYCIYNLAVIV